MDKHQTALRALDKLDDDELLALQVQFSMPWQYDADEKGYKDPDGFGVGTALEGKTRDDLQKECWDKFNTNPHLNTSVRGSVGRLTGYGFEISSDIRKVQDAIDEEFFDPRNRLYNFMPKFVGRSFLEGELFLCLTVHNDGFVEIDFIDPAAIKGGNGSKSGIFYHPNKTLMPVVYNIDAAGNNYQIPSIFVAHYPDILGITKKVSGNLINDDLLSGSKAKGDKFKSIGGFNRFIVSWDKSFISDRNIPYLRTVLEWLNYYENLKKYEIDHKKSSGSYLWIITIEDPKAFRVWLSMTDDERRATGIMAKKTPGSTLILPPGFKAISINPNLPKISESDTDILHMVTSGLNEPEDIATGQSKGTFASVKASRGPMSDRTSDEIAYFERFLKYDLFASIFFLKSSVSDFPSLIKKKEVVDFKKGEPVFETVSRRPEFFIDITFPVSETNDAEARARAYLGVKHGSTNDTLGIPNSEIAKKMGFGNYKKLRMAHATEQEDYPELILTADAESTQEKSETEPSRPKLKKRQGGKVNE